MKNPPPPSKKGGVLHYYYWERHNGQMIEAVDKMECQRADGRSETERGERGGLAKWTEQRRPELHNQVSVKQKPGELHLPSFPGPRGGVDVWRKRKSGDFWQRPADWIIKPACDTIIIASDTEFITHDWLAGALDNIPTDSMLDSTPPGYPTA